MAYEMAPLKVKTADGYDILHPHTRSDVVKRVNTNNTLAEETVEISLRSIENTIRELSDNKADKVENATNGNFAGLDSEGNVSDSGKKASDFAEAEHNHDASDITTGVLPLARGGLGAGTAAGALTNLGFTATITELNYTDGVTSNIQTQLNEKAPKASPALTGTPTAPTAAEGTNTDQLATTAFVQAAVNALMNAKDALRFVGFLAAGDTLPAAESGYVYRVTSDGTISGLEVHEGDTLTCCFDSTSANTPANWYVTHTNHDGQVMGPGSSVVGNVAIFDSVTGRLIADSGKTLGVSVPADAKFTDTVYTHPTTSGNKHIPTGGSSGQILGHNGDGTAAWIEPTKNLVGLGNVDNTADKDKPVSDAVKTELDKKQDDITGAASTITENNLTPNFALIANPQGKVGVSGVTTTELEYMKGVTSKVQDQINSKQKTINGAATTIVDDNLTASRVVVSNASGKVAVSEITATELNHLDGVTSNVQNQLNDKSKVTLVTYTIA